MFLPRRGFPWEAFSTAGVKRSLTAQSELAGKKGECFEYGAGLRMHARRVSGCVVIIVLTELEEHTSQIPHAL